MIEMKKTRLTLLICLGLVLIFTSSYLIPTLSLYKWNEPIFHYGDTTVIRRDIFDTVTVLSLSAFLATFALLIVRKKKGEDV